LTFIKIVGRRFALVLRRIDWVIEENMPKHGSYAPFDLFVNKTIVDVQVMVNFLV